MTLDEVSADDLKQTVERQHNCTARLIQSVPVREKFMRETVWEDIVDRQKTLASMAVMAWPI